VAFSQALLPVSGINDLYIRLKVLEVMYQMMHDVQNPGMYSICPVI